MVDSTTSWVIDQFIWYNIHGSCVGAGKLFSVNTTTALGASVGHKTIFQGTIPWPNVGEINLGSGFSALVIGPSVIDDISFASVLIPSVCNLLSTTLFSMEFS